MSYKRKIDQINDLINKKQTNDPNGFHNALSGGLKKFQKYLAADLKNIGVDPSNVAWDEILNTFGTLKQRQDAIAKVENVLDEVLFVSHMYTYICYIQCMYPIIMFL